MKSLETKELVLRISGDVQESNLPDFEIKALAVIENINLNLVTDQDFGEAKENIKSCKVLENRLANISNDAVMSQEKVAEAMMLIGKLQSKFRDTRLTLERSVKTEEAKRKAEIVNNGLTELNDLLSVSEVKHGFKIDEQAIRESIKGKRSLAKMEEAVDATVQSESERLKELEQTYTIGLHLIEESEELNPGLYPDKKNLALKGSEIVKLEIKARVIEQENKLRKIEDDKKAEEARRAAEDQKVEGGPTIEEAPKTIHPDEPWRDIVDPVPLAKTEQYRNHFFTVSIWGTSADAKKLAAEIGLQFQAKMVKVEVVTP